MKNQKNHLLPSLCLVAVLLTVSPTEVAAQYPMWGPLVRDWDRLTALYTEELPHGVAPKLYEAIRALVQEGILRA